MHRFIDGEDRMQRTLLPNSLEDYVGEENPVRVIEVFIDELDLAALGFAGMTPAATGRPAYHPSTLLKIYLYGYLNRLQSSRRLEREAQRNIELMWLSACFTCPLRPRCTPTQRRIIKRWENEHVLDRMQDRLDRMPQAMGVRRQTVEHPFGTLKAWMGATHFLTRALDKVRTEISLHVLAYNLKRMIRIFGVGPLIAAIT